MAKNGQTISSIAATSRLNTKYIQSSGSGTANNGQSTGPVLPVLEFLRRKTPQVTLPEHITSNNVLSHLLEKIPRRALEPNDISKISKLPKYNSVPLVHKRGTKKTSIIPELVRIKQEADVFLKTQLGSSNKGVNLEELSGYNGDLAFKALNPLEDVEESKSLQDERERLRVRDKEINLQLLEYQGYDASVIKKVGEIMDAISQDTCSTEFIKDQFADISHKLADFRLVHPLSSLIIQNTEDKKRNAIRAAFALVESEILSRSGHVCSMRELMQTDASLKKNASMQTHCELEEKLTQRDKPPEVVESEKSIVDEVDLLLSAIQEKNLSSSSSSISSSSFAVSLQCEELELDDYSKFTTPARKREEKDVQYISHLSCENLFKVLNIYGVDGINLEKIKELAREIDSGTDRLTLEEAEFILGEMGLLSTFKIYEKGKVVVEKRVDELVKRPIVVTIMGHVDHGKTTLLDRIQRTNIVDTEDGYITQKLGAFQVETARGKITFVDTPGHAAFGAMRSRGIKCADIVILVVSVDDGIMPQTLEALDLIKGQDMPCIVAVNKIDIGTDEMKEGIKMEVTKHLPDSPIVYISAKKGLHIDHVLDKIYEMETKLNAKTCPSAQGQAYVYETLQHPTRGKCLNVIVRDGTFKEGGWIVCGGLCGKIRRMYDVSGRPIRNATPSQIVQISWTQDIANSAGMFVTQYESFAKANELAILHSRRLGNVGANYNMVKQLNVGLIPEIKVILRCGDQGSLDAVSEWIETFNAKQRENVDVGILMERGYMKEDADVKKLLELWNPICVISKQIGPFNVNDANTAATGQVSFLGFNVDLMSGINLPPIVRTHKVVYNLFKDVEEMFKYYYGPSYVMKQEATLQVTRLGSVTLKDVGKKVAIGTMVKDGTARAKSFFILTRNGKTVARNLTVMSMHSSKRSVGEVEKGNGNNAILLNQDVDVSVGDELVAYSKEPLPPLFNTSVDCMLKVG